MNTNSFLDVAHVQLETGTMYCGGLDIHPFPGGLRGNLDVYQTLGGDGSSLSKDTFYFYISLVPSIIPSLKAGEQHNLALILSVTECYVIKVIDIMVKKCNVRVFKPQFGFYEQFGPLGLVMLSRIRQHIKTLEKEYDRIITILDCKRGDIATTQTASFLGLMGDLYESWGINYAPFDFDIINITPWMGEDVLAIGTEENPGIGLKLMREGKGIISVNKTSNPSWDQYQAEELVSGGTIQMKNVADLAALSKKYELEAGGFSNIGLVVGSTHVSNGEIRSTFPSATILGPGFGAQKGKFSHIIWELIRGGDWAGLGALFSSSRGTLYAWEKNFGGSGDPRNLEPDLITAIGNFRIAEKKAFEEPGLEEAGIIYPF